ncbi:MAG: isochorismatase family cysteine hydrolase, partial [Oscillospiraceae bacterium]|nr:isochorismatase family cysteine hydrolase [Oscillospiraceae bacterium]
MKKLLVVVDYQKDFVNGALGFAGAELLDARIAKKVAQYHREKDAAVIYTQDTHKKNYLKTQEGRKLPIVHCVRDTEGWEVFGLTAEACGDRDLVIEKPTFGSMELMEIAEEEQFDQVELVGLVSNICVLTNAVLLKTALPEAEIIVDASCTACADP